MTTVSGNDYCTSIIIIKLKKTAFELSVVILLFLVMVFKKCQSKKQKQTKKKKKTI